MPENNFIQRINDSFAKFAEWVLDHRLIVIIACIVLCIGSVFTIPELLFDFHPKSWSVEDDPSFDYYFNRFQKEFGNDEFIYIVYKAEQGIFDLNILQKTKRLAEEIKGVPYIKKVHSITNLEFMEGTRDGEIKVFNLMNEFPSNSEEADRIKQKFLDKPMYRNIYLSEHGDYAALLCEVEEEPDDDPYYQRKIGTSLREVLSKPEYNDFVFYPVGSTIIAVATWELLEENTINSSSLAFAMITLFLLFLLRQFKGVAGPFIIISITMLLILGFMAIFKLPITTLFGIIPAMIMAIGIADAVHIVSEYQMQLKAGNNNRAAILGAVKQLGFPCLFTSLTTAVGFISLTTSSLSPVRNVGLSIAFGILAAFALSFTFLIVILSFAGRRTEAKYKRIKIEKNHSPMDRMLRQIACFNQEHYKKVLIVSVVICISLIYGITKVDINTGLLLFFGDRVKMFNDSKFVDKTMGGTGNFEILLESKRTDGVKKLQFIQTLEKIQDFADTQDYLVKKTISLTDMVKDVNRALNDNDKSFYRVPPSEGAELQNINEFVYELYGGEELEKFVSQDYSSGRLTVYVKTSHSKIYNKFYDDLVSFIDSVKPADYDYKITGFSYLGVTMFHNMTEFMSKSIMLAIVIISIMMIFVFRSFKIGLISMIPNIFPIVFGLGFMGLTGIYLSHFTSIAGCIVIGLAVDDTIHFISRYRIEFSRLGDYKKALEASMTGVGRALTITTIILVMGFGACMVSKMDSMYYMSLVCSVCFIFALLADFFIAPALILHFKPFGEEFAPVEEAEEEPGYIIK